MRENRKRFVISDKAEIFVVAIVNTMLFEKNIWRN